MKRERPRAPPSRSRVPREEAAREVLFDALMESYPVELRLRMKKRCANCRRTFSRASFARLPLVGHRCFPANEDGPEEHLAYRNCRCGSTIVWAVAQGHAGTCRPQRDRARPRRAVKGRRR